MALDAAPVVDALALKIRSACHALAGLLFRLWLHDKANLTQVLECFLNLRHGSSGEPRLQDPLALLFHYRAASMGYFIQHIKLVFGPSSETLTQKNGRF